MLCDRATATIQPQKQCDGGGRNLVRTWAIHSRGINGKPSRGRGGNGNLSGAGGARAGFHKANIFLGDAPTRGNRQFRGGDQVREQISGEPRFTGRAISTTVCLFGFKVRALSGGAWMELYARVTMR